MSAFLLAVLMLATSCVGKHKAFCLDIHEGGMAHIKLGYFYDSTEMTITGPTRISTTPTKMEDDTCSHILKEGLEDE